jgi:hypothetical protein
VECPQVEKLMEYNDGELSQTQALEIDAHLAACIGCSRLLASLRREDKIYEEFGKDLSNFLEISPSMWDGIRNNLNAGTYVKSPSARRAFPGLLSVFSNILPCSTMARQILFASMLVIISVGATLLVLRRHDGREPIKAEWKEPRPAAGSQKRDLQSALLSIERAEREYIQAIQTLSGMVDERKASLDPGLVAELDRNLKTMDEAIASAQKVYHAHPADLDLAQYMLRAYQKKVELLQDLALRIT